MDDEDFESGRVLDENTFQTGPEKILEDSFGTSDPNLSEIESKSKRTISMHVRIVRSHGALQRMSLSALCSLSFRQLCRSSCSVRVRAA